MGLLDDAIREHLDLKRRRGADPTEVEREEREVLGPVRRRGEETGAEAHELDHSTLAHDEDVSWANGGAEYASGESEPRLAATAFDHGLLAEHDETPDSYPEPEPPPARFEPEPYRAREPEPPAPEPYAYPDDEDDLDDDEEDLDDDGPATAEYNVEAEHPPPEGESEDVLEETPEFLQDTPDHDRLWFEQRPPRDFDFDG
jgi:hypothetical protein